MSRPKSVEDSFNSEWNTAVAWAQSNGISASSYIPVYQQDAARLQSGDYPMSAGERNRAILAAADPNNVTPAPTDNPKPSNVFDNARNDLASIVTGLEPTHLVSGIWGTIKNTAESLTDPEKMEGANLGTTAANWLQDTLLSYVPGAYDIGTVLRADPTLSGDEGFKALMQHPLVSALDLLPAEASVTKGLATTSLGEALARASGQTTEELAAHGSLSALSKLMTSRSAGLGIKPGSAAEGITDITVGDKLQTWLQNSKLGTSGPVQRIVQEYMIGNQLSTGLYQSLMTPFLDTYGALSDEEQQTFQAISLDQQKGQNVEDLLRRPEVTEKVREAWEEFDQGPLRFEREEHLVGHGGDEPDVTPVRRPDGSIAVYSSKQSDVVFAARDGLTESRENFLKYQMEPADRLVQAINKTDQAMGQLATGLDTINQQARQATESDEDLLANVVVDNKGTKLIRGTKRDAARKVFGSSGYVDQLVQAMKKGEVDRAESLVGVVRSRTSKWDAYSVDAGDNPAFTKVAEQVDKVEQILKNRTKLNDELDKRIEGEAAQVKRETKENRVAREARRKELNDRHVAERKKLSDDTKAEVGRLNSARQVHLQQADALYERMKEAALVKGDQAAARATKAQADVIYASVKRDIEKLRDSWFNQKKQINDRVDRQVAETKLKVERLKPKMKKRQDTEIKELAEWNANEKQFHGSLMESMRYYTEAKREFNQAVYDHPSDEYVSAEVEIYIRRLQEHEVNARLIDENDKTLRERSGWEQSRLDDLHENPDLLREMVYLLAKDIYQNPLNFDPELASATKEAMDEVRKSGVDELNTLIAQGYKPKWIPRVDSATHVSSAIKATVGKGVPHVDAAMARVHDLTATRHDAVLGVEKDMAQILRRDATIDMVENSVLPRTITGSELQDQLRALPGFEGLDTRVGTLTDAQTAKLAEMGLTRVDPQSLFGFSFPRWQDGALYMPSGLATALQKMHALETSGDKGFFDKTNQIFRYSILGLSPRYTAHILFGGTFLLALRSTAYMPTMLVKAARMMKAGELPERIFRQPAQEGFGRMNFALQEHSWASGQQLAKLGIQEYLEKVQKIALSKASPLHYVKAAADLNFRFTRYATRLQSAVAYLDYAAKAERRGYFVDEVTGERIAMTKERAMAEGMSHVEQVFGDLRSMSPLERSVAKNILPFYGWTRHIIKYVLTMPADHPWRAMTLALIAYENSADVPKALPQRIQFLFFLGAPDAQGNVSAVDTRFMDPLRDVANYASLGGWLQGLNPVMLAPLAMVDPNLVYGSTSLYPNLTYNDMYGIETAGAQGSITQGLSQLVPQLGAVQPIYQALSSASNVRELKTDPNAFYKSIFESLNIPFAQVQKINVKQIAASDEIARYEVAKQAATNAFQSGDFSMLSGYSSVPNPLNPDYEITPKELQAIYNEALQQYPGQQPINVLLPPPAPAGY